MIYDCPAHVRLTDGHGWIYNPQYYAGKAEKVKKVQDVYTGEKIYKLNMDGISISRIAEMSGLSYASTTRRMRVYCQKNNIVIKRYVNEIAYEMCVSGMSTKDIAANLQMPEDNVRSYIGKYAMYHNLANPLKPKERAKTKGQTIYELRITGLSFNEIADRIGCNHGVASKLCYTYAKSQGLPIPKVDKKSKPV